MEIVQFRAMNTDIFLAAEGQPERLAVGFEQARQFILDSERRFTRFSQDSELSRLNCSGGSWFHASPDMVSVLLLVQHFVGLTQGLFDPSILPDLQRIGYDRSMDLIRAGETIFSTPSPAIRRHVPVDGMVIRQAENLVYLPPAVTLDLGGIAKGWIAEQAAEILAGYSPACSVNAGGDLFLVGLPAREKAWRVALENPLETGQALALLDIPPGAVATSSLVKRTWKQDGQVRHHLIDPRTGEPAVSDWLSVTVVSPHADTSEVFAKALLIAGPQEAETLINNDEQISYLAVDREGKIWGTQKSLGYLNEH